MWVGKIYGRKKVLSNVEIKMPGAFFYFFCLFFCLCLVFCLFFYAGTPFFLIIFNMFLSYFLGVLLFFFKLPFAATVMTVVNAGAITIVFLFVCILTRRDSTTQKIGIGL